MATPFDQGQEPIRIDVRGQSRWLYADGTTIRAIAGGDGTDDAQPPTGDPVTPPPANPPAQQPQPVAQQPAATDAEPFDRDRAMATIAKQREAEAAARKEATEAKRQAADLAAKLKSFEDAQLSETEKKDKRLAELESAQATWQRERQELTVRAAVQSAATRLRIVDPDAAYRLLDHSQIEYDPEGNPKNTDALLGELVKARPYLLPSASSGAATNPPSGGPAAGESEGDAIYRQLTGNGPSIWDAEYAKQHGGGVVVLRKD